MKTTKKQRLIECINNALKYYQKYVAIKIKLPDDKFEIITFNRRACIDKINYYEQFYTDDLTLKSCDEISVADFCCANTFEAIELELIGEEDD